MMSKKIASNASVSINALISNNVFIWDYSQIRENSSIGENSIIGSYVYVDANVEIGRNCKIQNGALIYDPAVIHDGVFIGPGAILTNDKNPRAVKERGELKGSAHWERVATEVFEGASIGAGAICIAPLTIGKWALVGAGAVVTKNVKDYAIVIGNPARQVGWVGPAGIPLIALSASLFQCPKTSTNFELKDSELYQVVDD
jgi:UDP-2-acetamido-3-amino-2,3-dideoxy-glucuronate N-acetyltransferase